MKDNLLNLLFNGKSSKKEKKKILTSLDKLDEVIETEREISIPTLRQLEQGYWELEEYRDKAFKLIFILLTSQNNIVNLE